MQNPHQVKKVHERRIFGLRILNRFRDSEDGVAAIEFGMLVLPFLMLLFAIIETALGFFAGQVFEAGVDTVGRRVRTGQVKSTDVTVTEMRNDICSRTWGLFTCANIKIDVRTFATFPDAPLTTPRDADNNLDESAFEFDTGEAGSIVVMRAYYEWPVFFDYLWQASNNLSNGGRLLVATMAFKNEPFSTGVN